MIVNQSLHQHIKFIEKNNTNFCGYIHIFHIQEEENTFTMTMYVIYIFLRRYVDGENREEKKN